MIKYGFAAVRSSLQALGMRVAEARRNTRLLRSMNAVLSYSASVGARAA